MKTINMDKLTAAYEQDCKEIAAAEEKAKTLRAALEPYVEEGIYTSEGADYTAGQLVRARQKQFDEKWGTLAAFIEDEQDKQGEPAEPALDTHAAYWNSLQNATPATDVSAESQDAVTATANEVPADDENI